MKAVLKKAILRTDSDLGSSPIPKGTRVILDADDNKRIVARTEDPALFPDFFHVDRDEFDILEQ